MGPQYGARNCTVHVVTWVQEGTPCVAAFAARGDRDSKYPTAKELVADLAEKGWAAEITTCTVA